MIGARNATAMRRDGVSATGAEGACRRVRVVREIGRVPARPPTGPALAAAAYNAASEHVRGPPPRSTRRAAMLARVTHGPSPARVRDCVNESSGVYTRVARRYNYYVETRDLTILERFIWKV